MDYRGDPKDNRIIKIGKMSKLKGIDRSIRECDNDIKGLRSIGT